MKHIVYARDNFVCQLCQKDLKTIPHTKNPPVHHIDGNKRNNEPTNLVTLCEECHQNIHVRMKKRRFKSPFHLKEDAPVISPFIPRKKSKHLFFIKVIKQTTD